MPVIATDDLPAFARLQKQGVPIIGEQRAEQQQIRPLDILIVNQMPNGRNGALGAMSATEEQLVDILAFASGIAQLKVSFTSPPNIQRSPEAQAHIDEHYVPFEEAMKNRVDAMIITGANTDAAYTDRDFWAPTIDIFEWGQKNVPSTITLCAATLAAGTLSHGLTPIKQPKKIWGVFPHYVVDKTNPLTGKMNTKMDVPHSRFGDFNSQELKEKGINVLIDSPDAGVHMLTDKTGFKWVGFLGHGEYDTEALHGEAKRDMQIHLVDKKGPFHLPENYYPENVERLIHKFAREANTDISRPEVSELFKPFTNQIDNTWRDSFMRISQSWLNAVYQVTDYSHERQYMDDPRLNPDRPLDFLKLG